MPTSLGRVRLVLQPQRSWLILDRRLGSETTAPLTRPLAAPDMKRVHGHISPGKIFTSSLYPRVGTPAAVNNLAINPSVAVPFPDTAVA